MQQLEHVAVGVQKCCHPTSPMFLLRGADEFHTSFHQRLVDGVDVFHIKIYHDSVWVLVLSFHLSMGADAESHVAPLEVDEVRTEGVGGETHRLCVELGESVQVPCPDYYTVDAAYHVDKFSDFARQISPEQVFKCGSMSL